MAERMSNLDYICKIEIPSFAEKVKELPEEICEEVSAGVLGAMVDTIEAAILFKRKRAISPEFEALVPKEYAEAVAQVLKQGILLCENAAIRILSSKTREEDYERLMAYYLKCFVDEETFKNSSFSEYVNF